MNAPESAILDRAVLDDLAGSVGGDHAFVVELIETFIADSAAQVDAAEAAIAADDAASVVRPAHTLKSSSATLGAARLAAQARALEMAGRSGTLDGEARAVASTLRVEWEAAVAALRAWVGGD